MDGEDLVGVGEEGGGYEAVGWRGGDVSLWEGVGRRMTKGGTLQDWSESGNERCEDGHWVVVWCGVMWSGEVRVYCTDQLGRVHGAIVRRQIKKSGGL